MEEMYKKPSKLKLMKLNRLLTDKYLKTKNNNKTELIFQKSLQKMNYFNYQNSIINTQNNFHISISKNSNNNNKTIKLDLAKKKPRKSVQFNLPYVFTEKNKNKKNYHSGNRINTISGYNNYLKIKSNEAFRRMNRILMEQTIKRLSMPKFMKSKRRDRIWKEKSKSNNNNEIIFDDDYYEAQKEKEKAKNAKESKKYNNIF